MPLYSLAYISRAPEVRGAPRKEFLAKIETESRSNNRDSGVSGALIHVDDFFIQVLEGSRGPMTETFGRIMSDERHSDVQIMRANPIPLREFTLHDMACYQLVSKDHPLFAPYRVRASFDPYFLSTEGTFDLLEKVVRVFKTMQSKDRKKRAA